MIMSNGTAKETELNFNGDLLEYVRKYKYLGIIISQNGNTSHMINDIVIKTKKALFMVKQALSTSQNVSVPLAMSLFDKQISPILLYGSPIWGIPNCSISIRIKANSE